MSISQNDESINNYINKLNILFKSFIDIIIKEANDNNTPIIISYYNKYYVLNSYKELSSMLFTFVSIDDVNMVIKVSMPEFIYKLYNNQIVMFVDDKYIFDLNTTIIDLYDLIKDHYDYDKDTCNPIDENVYKDIVARFKSHNVIIKPDVQYKYEPVDVKSLHFANKSLTNI